MQTTVVGSYPAPAWLLALPSTPNLRDAILVVLKTQEMAGIDVVADGELSRFSVSHPETNGMIDYFVAPLDGVETQLSRDEIAAFRAQAGMSFRAKPAGVVRSQIGEGQLNLPGAWEFVKTLTQRPLKFTVTSPYMLAKTLLDHHYGDMRALAMALADVLARQVAEIDAAVIQIDEANLTGHPDDGVWAFEPINHVLDAVTRRVPFTFVLAIMAAKPSRRGAVAATHSFSKSVACRSSRAGICAAWVWRVAALP